MFKRCRRELLVPSSLALITALVTSVLASAPGCDTSYQVAGGAGDAASTSNGGDGAVTCTDPGACSLPTQDGGGGKTDGSMQPIPWPTDFPAHFPGLRPATTITSIPSICAIDTTALTYTECNSGGLSKVTPNFYEVPTNKLVAAFFFDSVSFSNTTKITGSRGLVIVARGSISISGTLDASANRSVSGPGADALAPTAGGAKPADAGGDDNGGGGAGHGTAGADGAFSAAGTVTTNRGIGGAAYGVAADFTGGARGGAGNFVTEGTCGDGGGGGGALQISALGAIQITGNVLAGGGGGGGGCVVMAKAHAGGGGGSGGLIYLESRNSITTLGTIAANGGGGGGGAPNNMGMGSAGQNGGMMTAFGGASSGSGGGGGSGGSNVAPLTPASGLYAGGGGGAAGKIFFSAPSTSNLGTVSPPASPVM